MAIYYKFMSAKDYSAMSIAGPYISVGDLKQKILESKYKSFRACDSKNNSEKSSTCLGTDFDLVIINAQTNEEYVDDAMLIMSSSSVLLRRVPGNRRGNLIDTTTIVVEPEVHEMESMVQKSYSASSGSSAVKNSYSASSGSSAVKSSYSSSALKSSEESTEWDFHDFGDDVYAVHEEVPVQSSKSKDDEDSRINALVNTPALVYPASGSRNLGVDDRGFRTMGGSGFGGLIRKTPPEGYVCHRCKIPGHFIQHCPTNGDPKYDFKRLRPPAGIPTSMLVANADGSYKLQGGATAVLQPSETAFDKEMEGLFSSSRSSLVSNIPPELHCQLCKQVMKDAVLTSKCCFQSFCDKCIRDHIIVSKLRCVCGAENVLTDDLIPNVTVRDTIKRILETGSGSSTVSSVSDLHHPAKRLKTANVADTSESEPINVRDEALQRVAPQAKVEVEVQQKISSADAGKKKRKRKPSQDEEPESYAMPMGPSAYDFYWNGMYSGGMEGYMAPYASNMPYMGYGSGFNC